MRYDLSTFPTVASTVRDFTLRGATTFRNWNEGTGIYAAVPVANSWANISGLGAGAQNAWDVGSKTGIFQR